MKSTRFPSLPIILFFVFSLFFAVSANAFDRVVVVEVSGVINPVAAEFVTWEIEAANAENDALIVLELDTPGGLDTSMRIIIKSIQASKVPVVTYVSPAGSRAASAGTFITIASHIAAMAPGTNIGASHPVNLMGGAQDVEEGEDDVMGEKVVNDASAYIRSLAELRKRNAYWAELSVRKSISASAEEAKKLGVIDLVAASLDALILAVDGREVVIDSRKVQVNTKDKTVVFREMSARQKILDVISNPDIAYVLMMLGLVGLYFELSNPGLVLPGIIGGISMILALYGLQTLPVNYAGLMLILLGGILFIAEINVMSYGLLSAGGAISLALGSLMLIDSTDPAVQISRSVLYPTLVLSIAVSLGILYLTIKSHRVRSLAGMDGLIGEKGRAKTELDPEGSVFVHGETWKARSNDGRIESGETVVVEAVEGLKVTVRKTQKE